MFTIKKITQGYDPKQDRIYLSVKDAKSNIKLLWLTQKMANRLAGTLVSWLNEDLKIAASEKMLTSNSNWEQTIAKLQTWEQSNARSMMRHGSPVNRNESPEEVLLVAVGLKRHIDCYILTFKWEVDGAARLMLDNTQLRQWLIILYRQYTKARWSMHVWPGWFMAEEEIGATSMVSNTLN